MTAAYRPPDAAVREQALDPTCSFIVEAPAGSGKTELLTRRYLRLLATVSAPEEILAITFTRKAAAEMRSRVLAALMLAQQDAPATDSLKYAVWQLARAVQAQDQRHGWQLLSHPARLRIMTIDAFNLFLARQLPMISGAGSALPIAQDTRQLYADVALHLLERLGTPGDEATAIEQLLCHLDNRYSQFEDLLAQELRRREHWLELGLMRLDMTSLRQRLQATLRAVVDDELDEVSRCIPVDAHADLVQLAAHASAVLTASGESSKIISCLDMKSMPKASSDALPRWQGIAELLLTKEGSWRVQITKRIGILPEHKAKKQQLRDLLERLQRESELDAMLHLTRALPPTEYSDEQWRVLSVLLTVLKLAIAELEVVMRERNAADYPANAIAARRSLGTLTEPTDLALRLDYRLNHLLIDEFQDTSRGQVELLALLTAGWSEGDGRTLFCVGDPMQSIYRFRHADVGLFLNLKRHGLNQLRLTPLRLTVNFRSHATVLNWINATFAQVFPRNDDPARGSVAYTASEARKDVQTDVSRSSHVFVHATQGESASARAMEALEVAELIAGRRASEPSDRIAVLASNRSHLQAIIRELHAHGIAFQAVEIDALAQRPAILDLIALTRALVHLADRTAWLSILRAPWCGLSLQDLYALCGSQDNEATVLHAIRSIELNGLSADGQARVARCLPVLEQALNRRGRMHLRDCVEGAWLALGGPATLANATALQDCQMYLARLEQLERNGDLEDVAKLESQLVDLFAAGDVQDQNDSSANNGSVELMTIHRAKGLEFDIVIVPALDAGVRRDDSPLLRAQELPHIDNDALLLAPIAASGSEPDLIYTWLDRMERDRARFERSRLLYVAATRAERELHLFGAVKLKNSALVKPTANTFLHLLWPVVEPAFTAQLMSDAPLLTSGVTAQLDDNSSMIVTKIVTKRLPITWQRPRPVLMAGNPLQTIIEDQPLHPEFEWASEAARHVGTIVHREIERIARVGFSEYVQAPLAERAEYFRVGLAELGVPELLREVATTRVTIALQKMLSDARGRWLLAGSDVHQEVASELSISGVVDGDLVNGIIDRTFVDQDGVRWVVDFKTSTHEGGGLEQFLDSEAERYRLQLTRYVSLMRAYRPDQPIRAALYFPLLSAWREVLLAPK